ncbi:hypothetical protein [Rhodanobacter sp. B04]|nr:hypothetical protein [Rhodanobacter sp. B04]
MSDLLTAVWDVASVTLRKGRGIVRAQLQRMPVAGYCASGRLDVHIGNF